MKKLILFVFCIFSICVNAYIPTKLSVSDLYDFSDKVAIVQVISGEVLTGKKETTCGAKYKVKILNSFKGLESKFISFGRSYGFSIGSEYLLFLTKENIQIPASTNSKTLSHDEEYYKYMQRNCAMHKVDMQVLHDGYGAMKIEKVKRLGYLKGVQEKEFAYFPQEITRVSNNQDKKDALQWVSLSDVIEHLKFLENQAK